MAPGSVPLGTPGILAKHAQTQESLVIRSSRGNVSFAGGQSKPDLCAKCATQSGANQGDPVSDGTLLLSQPALRSGTNLAESLPFALEGCKLACPNGGSYNRADRHRQDDLL